VKVRISDHLVYWMARAAIGTAARVPQWLGYTLADWLGRLFFRCDRRRRGYALRMLHNAFPQLSERELLRIGSRATGNLFKVPLDMARLTRLLARGGRLETVIDYGQARQHFSIARPWVGLSAHLGNWEVGAVGVAQLVGKAHGMGRIARNPLLERWIVRNRSRGGLTIHPRRGGIRDLAKALEDGHVGLMVVDQNQRLRGVFAPFFGEIASCERGAVTLALRRGYRIVVAVALRRGRGFRFEMASAEPFVLERTGDKQKDLHAAVVRVNQTIEQLVRRAPEQYLWIHDRYRTQPPAGPAAAEVDGDDLDAEP